MIIFIDHKGIIYQHAVPLKTTMNGEYFSFEIFAVTHIGKAS